jgi:hypothetical protein
MVSAARSTCASFHEFHRRPPHSARFWLALAVFRQCPADPLALAVFGLAPVAAPSLSAEAQRALVTAASAAIVAGC